MAGIGFELRRILKEDRLLSLAKVYSYSALLSSGAWVISIVAIIAVGFINFSAPEIGIDNSKFKIVTAYTMILATSLIYTGAIQLPFTRYIADLVYSKREDEVLASYFGVILLSWIVGFLFFFPLALYAFSEQSTFFIVGVVATFLILCGVWISNVLASSLKYYTEVVSAYFIAYLLIIVLSYFFGNSLESLMFIFFTGNALLFIILMSFIIKSYHSTLLLNFNFFYNNNIYYSLAIAGLFYNLGAWVDKFIFWYHPLTGNEVIGELHASIVYDLPIFLAYLSILPGMAVFFFRLEADFAQKYDLFFDAVRSDGTLEMIRQYRNDMVDVIRHSIREVLVIQGIINIMLILTAPTLFAYLNIPQLYLSLFHILTIGAMLQLGFMSVLAILYYLDRKEEAMWLSIIFFVLNTVLSLASIYMGPAMFGYGYAFSLLISFVLSLGVLREELEELDYETFMLQ